MAGRGRRLTSKATAGGIIADTPPIRNTHRHFDVKRALTEAARCVITVVRGETVMPTSYGSLSSLLQQSEDLLVARKPLPTDPVALADRCDRLRLHVTEALGYMPPHGGPVTIQDESRSAVGDDLIRETILLDLETGGTLRIHVIRPTEVAGPLPGAILLHGWDLDKTGLDSAAFEIARAGYLLLLPDNECVTKGAEECLDGCSYAIPGMTYMGLTTYENLRSLDYMCSRNDVDASRVACIGVCWTGIQCYLLTALDQRVKAASTICGIAAQGTLPTDFLFPQGHMCIGSFLPGLLTEAGIQDLMALIAPRPLLVQNNVSDEWSPVMSFRRSRAETKRVYRTMGYPDRFEARVEMSTRNLTPEFIARAVEWLKAYL